MIKTIAKIFAWIIFSGLFTLVLLFLGVFHFGLLEYGINSQLKEIVGAHAPLEVSVGEVTGDYFSSLSISGINVVYDDGLRRYPLASIKQVNVSYTLADLWRGQINIHSLELDQLQATLMQDTTGAWLLPRPQPGQGPSLSLSPVFTVDTFSINNGRLTLKFQDLESVYDSLQLSAGVGFYDGALALDLRTLTGVSRFHDSRILSGSGKITLSDGRLVFKDIKLREERASIEADGYFSFSDEIEGRVLLKGADMDMNYLGELVNKNYTGHLTVGGDFKLQKGVFSGPLSLIGSFQGRSFEQLQANIHFADGVLRADSLRGEILEGCSIAGDLQLDFNNPAIAYTFSGDIANLNIKNLTPAGPQSWINGAIKLDGAGLTSRDMNIGLSVILSESTLDIFQAHQARGSLRIFTDSLHLLPGFAVDYFENTFFASGTLEYTGQLDISGEAVFRKLSRFRGLTFVEEPAGRAHGSYRLTGDLQDPNISGLLFSDSLWLNGLYSKQALYKFDIKRFLTRRSGAVGGRLSSGLAWDFPLDSAEFRLRLDSNLVLVDELNVYSPEIVISSSVTLDYGQYPVPVEMHDLLLSFNNSEYRGADTVTLHYDSAGVSAEIFDLTNGAETIQASGRMDFDGSFDLGYMLNNVDIAPWTVLLPENPQVRGVLTCSGMASGVGSSLTFDVVGKVDSLWYYDLLVGDFTCGAHYLNRKLTIDTAHLNTYSGNHSVRGVVPLDLRLGKEAEELFPAEQRLELKSEETGFDFVSFFLPQVERLEGELAAAVVISGTPLSPRINGSATFSEGKLKIYELAIPAESLFVSFSMNDRLVTISEGACRFPPKLRKPGKTRNYQAYEYGYVELSGDMEILRVDSIDYNVTLQAKNVPLDYTLGDFHGKADAELLVSGLTPPTVTGEVGLISAIYEEEFLPEDAGYVLLSQFETPEAWNIDINAIIKSNLVVRNTELDAEFRGTANMRRTRGLWSFAYDLEVIRGRVFLPTSTFRLDPQGTVVNDDYTINNPRLNLIARTRIRVPDYDRIGSEESSNSRQAMAVIQVTGTLDNPIILHYDDPALTDNEKISEDQLYQYLALGGRLEGGQLRDIGVRAADAAAAFVSANLTRAGARTIGVETFDIDPDLDVQRTKVTLGSYVLPGLYSYGKSDIGGTGLELGFEAYISQKIILQGRRDEDNLYSVFFNLGWDY